MARQPRALGASAAAAVAGAPPGPLHWLLAAAEMYKRAIQGPCRQFRLLRAPLVLALRAGRGHACRVVRGA
jgi:hypothetical protein